MADRNPAHNGPPGNRAAVSGAADTTGDPGVVPRPAQARIDLGDEGDVQRWADRLSVTRAQLEEAVSAVGDDAHAVQVYLRGQGGGD